MRFSSSITPLTFIFASLCLVQGAPLSLESRQSISTSINVNRNASVLHAIAQSFSNYTKQYGFNLHPVSTGTATLPVNNTDTTTSSCDDDTTDSTPESCDDDDDDSGSTTSPVTNTTSPISPPETNTNGTATSKVPGTVGFTSCFPALDFTMPDNVPDSLDGWWCDMKDEYAFLGFSYEISACQSQEQLTREFKDARETFDSRYIRLYGTCDQEGYYDQVIEAAWEAGLGVQALVWFGFDGDNKWMNRKKNLFKSLNTNPKAKFVTRAVQFGSEPLFDYAIDPTELANQVLLAQKNLSALEIPVTVSELAYGFQSRMADGSQAVLDAIDFVDVHMLPYFAQNASTGGKAWYNNMYDMDLILKYTKSKKKIIWSQNGWPSTHYCPGVCPNSDAAVSSVKSEKAYYNLLDSKCSELKQFPMGGVGWFAHIYSDNQEPGYGIYDSDGNLKFDFAPQTSC